MDIFISPKKRKVSDGEPRPIAFDSAENEDTDIKLATLASIYDSVDQATLLEALINANGSVEEASKSLEVYNEEPKRKSTQKVIGYQSSLSSIFRKTERHIKPLTKKGQTLHLYSPEDIAAHAPCSIIHNFLPPEEANNLLKELLAEAPTFERFSFKVFDNVVQSPHTSCFYVESLEEKIKQQTEYVYNGSNLTVCYSIVG
jgi:hypothetical protein